MNEYEKEIPEKQLYKASTENIKSYGIMNAPVTNINAIFGYNIIVSSETQNFIDKLLIFSQKNILNSLKDITSTKYLQLNLISLPNEIINYILYNLKTKFREIIKNKNGNYFCSDLIKKCNFEQRIEIIKELSNTLYEDCNNKYANYTIKNLIAASTNEIEFKLLISSFNDCNKIITATLNKHGNYVIQGIIKYIPEEFRTDFNILFTKCIYIFSKHEIGVFAAKYFICNTKNNIIKNQILIIIWTNFIDISQNQYGNYVIQLLLKLWWNKSQGNYLKKIINEKYQILIKNKHSLFICHLFNKLNKKNS